MPKITLKPEEARGIVYRDHERATVISTEIVDTSRWSVHYECIFELDGKFYQVNYSRGATECQDEKPFQDESSVDCVEVHEVEKVCKVWELVEG